MVALRPRSVRNTPELQRIRSLPRRRLTKAKAAAEAVRLTPVLSLPGGGGSLRDWQGISLAEVVRVKGGLLALPVGQGKTLIAEAVPVLLNAAAACLVLPATLRDKTYADRADLRTRWRLASPPPRLVSKEELALETNALLLDTLYLKCAGLVVLVIDESDELSNATKGAPKRIDRFVTKRRARCKALGWPWPYGVAVVSMTGTLTRRSIMAYWHHLRWGLGDGAPVPTTRAEAETWANALDDAAPRAGFRPMPGALGADITQARAWYLDRLRSTPGVVIVDEDSAGDVPLHIALELAPACPRIDRAFDELRKHWRSPSGEDVTDPLSLFRIEADTGVGVVRYWDPPPPQEWSVARRVLAKFIRDRVAATSHAMRPLDTDAQVIREHPEAPAVREWLRVRDTFDPLKSGRTRWLSDVTLEWVAEWLLQIDRPRGSILKHPSVLWCGGVEFAERLARLTRLPYYGRQGKCATNGRQLHDADPWSSMICSWHANRRGFNLQAWRRHGIIQGPQSAKALEQIYGRPHRAGQRQPVHFTHLMTSGGSLDSFAAALGEAEFARDTVGHTQKILRAEFAPFPDAPSNLRWATKD